METYNQITEIDLGIIFGTIAFVAFFLIRFYKKGSKSATNSTQNV